MPVWATFLMRWAEPNYVPRAWDFLGRHSGECKARLEALR